MRPYTNADQEAWDGFVLRSEGSTPAQTVPWLTVTAETYRVPLRAWLAEDAGTVRGILPLFEKRGFGAAPVLFSAPGGLLATDEDAARCLLETAAGVLAAGRLAYVELRDQQVRWPGLETTTEHCTHVLPLEGDVDGQWRAFDAKLRNQIRKAQRAGFAVRWGHEQLGAFCRVMLENMRDLGTPMRGEAYFRRVLDALGDAAAVLVIARDGEPVGAMFLAVHRGIAWDIWASSLRREFAHCPNQMLYWEALQEAMRRGLRAFDFGRSQWDTGTFRFKEQWGARPVQLYYQYVMHGGAHIPTFADQQRRLGLAAQLWKRLPLPLARVLGDPIRRRFPELL